MSDKCPQTNKWFGGGCNFEARYDEHLSPRVGLQNIKLGSFEGTSYQHQHFMENLRSLYVDKVYVRDVCTRCGRIIGR